MGSQRAITRIFMLTCALSAVLIGVIPLAAQSGANGAIAITILDPTSALIPSAAIDVISQQSGLSVRRVSTNDDGRIVVGLLSPGQYKIVASKMGFATATAADVRVRVTETTSVSLRLQVAPIAQETTIATSEAAVQLTTPTTGRILQSETIEALPLSTRNFLTLLTLSSGTNTELFDSAALGRGLVTITVNGQRPANNNYQLEGINANDFNNPIFDNVPLPNPESLREFKTQTSLYDASYGRNSGGNIQVGLKSGGTDYHFDAYEFFRNDALNANDFFLNRAGQRRPVLRQNQFGLSASGPIPGIKNFFVFGNYQGTRATSGIAAGTTLNQSLPVIPGNRTAANLISTFFPGGLPTGFTGLDPVAMSLLTLPASKCPAFNDGTYCIPTLPGTAGFTGATLNAATIARSSPGKFHDDQFTLSLDKSISDADKLTVRWFYADFSSVRPLGTTSSLAFALDNPNSNRFLKLGWSRVVSPSMVNEARIGLNRFTFQQTPSEPISLTDIGAVRPNSADFPAAYRFNITGGFSIGTGSNDDKGGAFNTFVFGDDLTWSLGKHQVRIGGEATRYQLNRFNRFGTRGVVNFATTAAGAGGAGIPSLVGFQNFLLGRVTGTQAGSGFYNFYFRNTDFAAYIADDWRIHPRVVLNIGLRWEGIGFAHEKQNMLSNFSGLGDGTAGPIQVIHPEDTARVGTPGVSRCTLLNCFDGNNFAPRIGVAWDPLGDAKNVIRAGYGVYFQRPSNQEQLLASNAGLPFNQTVSGTAFSVTMANPFPTLRPLSDFPLSSDLVVPKLTSFNGTTGAPVFDSSNGAALSGFFFFPVRTYHAPYAQHWNLTLQREVFRRWVAEIGYVGTRGVALPGTGRPLNPAQICTNPKPCVIPAAIGSTVIVPTGTPGITKNADGSIAVTESTAANANARVPSVFMGYANNRGFFQDQAGQSTYHSFQTSLTRSWSNGIYVQAAYTWSKSMDNGTGSTFVDELGGLQWHFGDMFDRDGNIGLSDFDRTHRLVVSYNYELPFARWSGVQDRGLGRLLHGWSLNGITTYQSGTPFMIFDGSAITLEDPESQQPSNKATLLPGGPPVLTTGNVRQRLDSYVNFGAFVRGGSCVDSQMAIVTCGSTTSTFAAFGNLGRNAFRGPFQNNWDMSITKRTRLTEGTTLEFRTEFFNVWNHAAFQSPRAAGTTRGNYGVVDVASGNSSILATVNKPRIIQFGVKLNY